MLAEVLRKFGHMVLTVMHGYVYRQRVVELDTHIEDPLVFGSIEAPHRNRHRAFDGDSEMMRINEQGGRGVDCSYGL